MLFLKNTFIPLVEKYNADIAQDLCAEIEMHYTEKQRHYHTLQHLEYMLLQLQNVQPAIEDWDSVLFALFYHDIIYKSTQKDNEEKSAALAEERLSQLGFHEVQKQRCIEHILATKAHLLSKDNDTNLFTDADLSILGAPREQYKTYCQQVRKEYSIYPDFLYNPGRKKVLQHFLSMDRIYKTGYFYNSFEETARENLATEISIL